MQLEVTLKPESSTIAATNHLPKCIHEVPWLRITHYTEENLKALWEIEGKTAISGLYTDLRAAKEAQDSLLPEEVCNCRQIRSIYCRNLKNEVEVLYSGSQPKQPLWFPNNRTVSQNWRKSFAVHEWKNLSRVGWVFGYQASRIYRWKQTCRQKFANPRQQSELTKSAKLNQSSHDLKDTWTNI